MRVYDKGIYKRKGLRDIEILETAPKVVNNKVELVVTMRFTDDDIDATFGMVKRGLNKILNGYEKV